MSQGAIIAFTIATAGVSVFFGIRAHKELKHGDMWMNFPPLAFLAMIFGIVTGMAVTTLIARFFGVWP